MNRAQTQAPAEQERLPPTDADLQGAIVDLMHMARSQERQSLNACMLQTYWRIGQQLVQFEHRGARTDGLSGLLAGLAARLNPLLGSHFSAQSLLECRAFYRAYPTLPAIRRKLSWHVSKPCGVWATTDEGRAMACAPADGFTASLRSVFINFPRLMEKCFCHKRYAKLESPPTHPPHVLVSAKVLLQSRRAKGGFSFAAGAAHA